MKRLLLLALPLLAAAAGGCGSSSNSSSTSTASSTAASSSAAGTVSAPASGAIEAKMQNFAFSPKTITARVGQTIHWINVDNAPHNVTGTSGPKFTASPTFSSGGSFTLKLTQPGTYQYICTVHPFMKGTIVVSR